MTRTRRGFTLIEVIVATLVTSVVAGSVVGMVEAFRAAVAVQDLRSEAIVRGAGVQSHLGLLALKTRMTLSLSPQRILLWLPSETLSTSGTGSDTEFDLINLLNDELHWLEFLQDQDLSWTLIEWTVKPGLVPSGASTTYFSSDGEFWDSLFVQLRDSEMLRRSTLASGLDGPQLAGGSASPPKFVWQTASTCENRSLGAEFAFVADDGTGPLRSDLRVESALAFFDRHPICSEE